MCDVYESIYLNDGIQIKSVTSPKGRQVIPAGSEAMLAQGTGPGRIKRLFFVPGDRRRSLILRIYWDGCADPAVECPLGDFFAAPLREYKSLSACYLSRQPGDGVCAVFPMPFQNDFRVTLENRSEADAEIDFQISYEQCPVPVDAFYFHAQFSLSNPTNGRHTLLSELGGTGAYIGTSLLHMCGGPFSFSEGAVSVVADGNSVPLGQGPDGLAGSCDGCCTEFSTPYSGVFVYGTDACGSRGKTISSYRLHVGDPIYFGNHISAYAQIKGIDSQGRVFDRRDTVATVSYFYLNAPCTVRCPLPSDEKLCVE